MSRPILLSIKLVIIMCFLLNGKAHVYGQDTTRSLSLTVKEIISLAKKQSTDASLINHNYLKSYWAFRSYKAAFLPNLNFSGQLIDYNQSFVKEFDDGAEQFVFKNNNNTVGELNLDQNIPFTGGQLSLSSSLSRYDDFSLNTEEYSAIPLRITYRQDQLLFNEYEWLQKTKPLEHEIAKRKYIEDLEQVAIKAISISFDVILAQINLQLAKLNKANSDTLYNMAKGRFSMGTIAEDELLQMELENLNADLEYTKNLHNVKTKQNDLISFLNIKDYNAINVEYSDSVGFPAVDFDFVWQKAEENNSKVMELKKRMLEVSKDLEKRKAEKNLNLSLYGSVGLTQRSAGLSDAYIRPNNYQDVSVGIQIPIVDWGERKSRYYEAKSAYTIAETETEQAYHDFEKSVYLKVLQYNLMEEQLTIAAKAIKVADERYKISKFRYQVGKINATDLSNAKQERDQAHRSYISTLKEYYNLYYELRQLTLYDFVNDKALEVDFENVLHDF